MKPGKRRLGVAGNVVSLVQVTGLRRDDHGALDGAVSGAGSFAGGRRGDAKLEDQVGIDIASKGGPVVVWLVVGLGADLDTGITGDGGAAAVRGSESETVAHEGVAIDVGDIVEDRRARDGVLKLSDCFRVRIGGQLERDAAAGGGLILLGVRVAGSNGGHAGRRVLENRPDIDVEVTVVVDGSGTRSHGSRDQGGKGSDDSESIHLERV